jgi:hypothetical protein
MPRQELLTESQRLSLQSPAIDERTMVRHYTLSSEDLAPINRRRGEPNRLGFPLMLCYLRFPWRILQQGEEPPAELCAFVAEQLGLNATKSMSEAYIAMFQNTITDGSLPASKWSTYLWALLDYDDNNLYVGSIPVRGLYFFQ